MEKNSSFNTLQGKNHLTIIFGSTLKNVDKACRYTLTFLSQAIPDFRHEFEINLLMREGLMNAVKHGNEFAPDKLVHFSIRVCQPDTILMEIEDQGKGFQWHEMGHDLPDDYAESGRGIFIIRQYCSLAKYNAKGNHLTIHKQLNIK